MPRILAAVMALSAAHTAMGCEDLLQLRLPDTEITLAEAVPAGEFVSEVDAPIFAPPTDYGELPAFCRVAGTVRPVPGSEIRFEVWLPDDWNGRFVGVGNGANTGAIFHWDMAPPLASGYAVGNTDTGHVGDAIDGRFMAEPEKLVDFAERAVHEMTIKAKAVVTEHYGRAPGFSYWTGCSTGGRQGLTEAQRYPGDYDGIAAGAPAANWVPLNAWAVVVEQTLRREEGGFPPAKVPLLQAAAIEACDAADGVRDRVLTDPRTCTFDPGVLQCSDSDQQDCLTADEVAAAESLYRGVVHSGTGEQIYPGALPSSEGLWTFYLPGALNLAGEYWRHAVIGDPDREIFAFDPERDVERATHLESAGLMTPLDPDLRAFAQRGGKFLLWHGWTDGAISPLDSIGYYQSVVETMGERDADESVRLFLMPGVDHCEGGEGPDQVDFLSALVEWVEEDVAPERIVATKALGDDAVRSRPLCPYPGVARYSGSGSTDDAGNFVCRAPE